MIFPNFFYIKVHLVIIAAKISNLDNQKIFFTPFKIYLLILISEEHTILLGNSEKGVRERERDREHKREREREREIDR